MLMLARHFLKTIGILMLVSVFECAAAAVPCNLDPLLEAPANWQMTPDAFEAKFTEANNRLFVWLTKDHTRAKLNRRIYANAEIGLNAFGGEVPVQEVIVDFEGGKLNLVTLSIFNRGDGGDIGKDEFSKRFTSSGKAVGKLLGAPPREKKANPQSGLLTAGYSWYSAEKGTALLEHNEQAMNGGEREFLRLRIARPNAKGSLAAAMTNSRGGAAIRLSDLTGNLTKSDNGDVFINHIPMVDQGDKGYCVVASVQRVFEYYGIGADMHQLAQIAQSDPNRGTNILIMAKELDSIDYRFKTRLEIIGMGPPGSLTQVKVKKGEYFPGDPLDPRKFLKTIQSSIDSGLPVFWALELGRFPERPQLTPQAGGGHMRLIIGYNEKDQDILFTDSWGAGHELKKMRMSDSYQTTLGLFVLKPTVH